MNASRHYTIGAVARDLRVLEALEGRVWNLELPHTSMVVLARGRDERLIEGILPEAEVRRVETGLSKAQWLEFASTYIGVTAVSVLMGAVHLATGLTVQAVLTLAAIIGLIVYHRRPHLQKKLLELALPEKLAGEWNDAFPGGLLSSSSPCRRSTSRRRKISSWNKTGFRLRSPWTGDQFYRAVSHRLVAVQPATGESCTLAS